MNAWSISSLAFIGTSALTWAILQLVSGGPWRVAKRLNVVNRSTDIAREDLRSTDRKEQFPLLPSLLERLGCYQSLERALERAGLHWLPGEFMALCIAGSLTLAIVGWLLFGPLAIAAGIAVAAIAAWLTIIVLQNNRLSQFEKHFPDALTLMASSLRSGYGMLRSMQAIRDEMKPPISTEFGRVLDDTTVGLSVHEALLHLSQRVPLPDLDIAISAMLIRLDIGGNLAEMMDIIAGTVRERQRIASEVNALTSEGRLSGVILFLLPIAMLVALSFLNRSYMSVLIQTSFGHILLICAATLQVIGGLVIMRMLKINF